MELKEEVVVLGKRVSDGSRAICSHTAHSLDKHQSSYPSSFSMVRSGFAVVSWLHENS
jgi:hypothetical protein